MPKFWKDSPLNPIFCSARRLPMESARISPMATSIPKEWTCRGIPKPGTFSIKVHGPNCQNGRAARMFIFGSKRNIATKRGVHNAMIRAHSYRSYGVSSTELTKRSHETWHQTQRRQILFGAPWLYCKMASLKPSNLGLFRDY